MKQSDKTAMIVAMLMVIGLTSATLAGADPSLTPIPLGPPATEAPSQDSANPDAPAPVNPDDPDLPPPLPPGPTVQSPMLPAPSAEDPGMAPPEPVGPDAYAPPDRGITRSPSLIAECLCTERRMVSLRQQSDEAQRRYTDAKARLASLNDQLNRSKDAVNSDDEEQVDAYRRLLVESEQLNARLFNDILPRSQTTIGRYNAAVERYNARCTGRRFDSAMQASVSASLTCP